MPQNQVFGFQLPSRLEAVAQHADEEEANCDHQSQSCSDSLAAVTPADGVFGSDTYLGLPKLLVLAVFSDRMREKNVLRVVSQYAAYPNQFLTKTIPPVDPLLSAA